MTAISFFIVDNELLRGTMQRPNERRRSEYLLRQAHRLEGRQGPKPLRLDTFKGKRIDEFDIIVLIDIILDSAWDENVFLEGYTTSADT